MVTITYLTGSETLPQGENDWSNSRHIMSLIKKIIKCQFLVLLFTDGVIFLNNYLELSWR